MVLCAVVSMGQPARAEFDAYLWHAHRPDDLAEEAAPLVAHLRRQIDAILEAGHLAPLRFSGADQIAEGFYLYSEPGRILNTLGAAYPYLETAQQDRLRAYVAQELSVPAYAPWSDSPHLPPDEGARREPYAMSRPWQWDWARQRAASRPRVAPLYGLWLCAYETGDWTAVSNHWPAVRQFYESNHRQANLYGTFGAHLAVARMAQHLGDATTRATAVARSNQAFTDGLNLELMIGRMRQAYARHFDGFNDRNLAHGNWFFLDLVPEVGRYLRDNLREPVLERQRALQSAFPHWWVYRPWYASGWTGHESQGLPPEILGMLFPIERWVVGAPKTALTGYHPQHAAHGLGDCHALESLVLTLSAHGPDRWLDVRTEPSPPLITLAGKPLPAITLEIP